MKACDSLSLKSGDKVLKVALFLIFWMWSIFKVMHGVGRIHDGQISGMGLFAKVNSSLKLLSIF